MSGAESHDPREAALQRLVRDARDASAPDLDWARIEQRLLQATKQTPAPVKRASRPLAWGALGVAAAAALWMISTRSPTAPSTPSPPDVAVAPTTARDGDALAIGSHVTTDELEATVAHAGRATWTLAPHGSALLAGRDERITVRLERGSVLSQVVPNPKPETFVVEAAGTRVAVHGTRFRVALRAGHVIVEVREGVVAVGPLDGVPAFLLTAGTNGDFAADGRSGTINGRPVGETSARPTEPQKPAPLRALSNTASSALAPAASAELPSEPSISDIESGFAGVVDAATDCFTRYTQSTDGVQITVRTALSLQILDSGAVTAVDFQPPLSPEAAQCAAASISDLHFAPSKQGAKVTRMLELKK